MRSDLTEIAFILDRPGSMKPLTNEAIGGFNAFLETQQREPGAAALISLVLFDNEYLLVYRSQDIHQVPKLTEQAYQPSGTTALLDAIVLLSTHSARNSTKCRNRCVRTRSLSRS